MFGNPDDPLINSYFYPNFDKMLKNSLLLSNPWN